MKYIIIGLAIVYIGVPLCTAMRNIDSLFDIPSEWWEEFKDFAPLVTAIIAIAVALSFIIYDLVNLMHWG